MCNIQLNNIDHSYGGNRVLQDFTFIFESGNTYCILGPSGCGKTTLLRLIAGLETPQKGTIQINKSIASESENILVPPHLREIGFVFQDLALWPHFSVYENIAFGLKERKEKMVKEKVFQMLDLFGIADQVKKYPHRLSGGQKQMVAIARSLVLNPKILLLDEPMANIDGQIKEFIINHLYNLQKQNGFTMLYVTHDHRETIQTGNYIVMNNGKIEVSGTREKIRNSSNNFVKSFIKI